MKEALFYLKEDKVLKFAFLSSSFLLLLQILFLIFTYKNLPPLIPLYLQRPWGQSQIAPQIQIFLLPALTLFLIIFNTFLSTFLYKESPLLSRILLWGQAIFCLLATLAVVRIILLII